jgi:glycosyltransferase involved in cell wall biosynthesis
MSQVHDVCVVIPVYRGGSTLPTVVPEVLQYSTATPTPRGNSFRIVEVLLVHDCGPDDSADVIHRLQDEHHEVRAVWLSRNFGQHAATIAGMASSSSPWVVTMDEDGQHFAGDIASMLDVALEGDHDLVYGHHVVGAPHPSWRNAMSRVAKRTSQLISGTTAANFSSMRLIDGESARAVAAYCGPRVYLDIALAWVVRSTAMCPISTRDELRHESGYNLRRLASHFWTLVLSSGTRPLRIVSLAGILTSIVGFIGVGVIVFDRIRDPSLPQGWPSVICAILVVGGVILLSLGVVAEYVGAILMSSLGRPLYVIVDEPRRVRRPAQLPGDP